MKIKSGIAIILSGMLFMSSAAAVEKKKATVNVQQVEDKIHVIITPTGDYKWNKLYPAKLKFSVCNENECVFFTEDINIKERT